MESLSRFSGCLFCIVASITSLTACSSGAISNSTPWSRTDATAPLESYPMRIKNGTSFEITFGTVDQRCMLKVPPTKGLHPTDSWSGDIATKTDEKCKNSGAKFVLYIDSAHGDAEGEWQKSQGARWRVVRKSEKRLCIEQIDGALDVVISVEPQSGCASR